MFCSRPIALLSCLLLLCAAGEAAAQTVAFVAPAGGGEGNAATAVRRAVIRCHTVLAESGSDDLEVLESSEVRRALAGMPANGDGDDPLADVRRFVRRAEGDRLSQNLARLGERLDLDLLVTVRRVGGELELRAFNTGEAAFYRGTLMVAVAAPIDADELTGFVLPRAGALSSDAGEEGDGEEETTGRRRGRNRWWIWAIIGGTVAAAILVGYLAAPDEVENTGVTLRIQAP